LCEQVLEESGRRFVGFQVAVFESLRGQFLVELSSDFFELFVRQVR